MHLLRKAGVDANWTWDQTMRSIITDPLYKALNTLAEKKATSSDYDTQISEAQSQASAYAALIEQQNAEIQQIEEEEKPCWNLIC